MGKALINEEEEGGGCMATFNERLKWKDTRTDSNLSKRNVEKSAFPTG